MNKNELYKLLSEAEKQADKARLKRVIITVVGYAIGMCYIFCLLGDVSGFADIALFFLLALIASLVLFFINTAVYHWLFERSRIEQARVENIKNQISALDAKECDELIKKEIHEKHNTI